MLRRQSRPRIWALPALGRRNPSSVRISVDLPAPLGPSNPTAFPLPETPRRQVIPWRISRRPSFTFRFSSSTTGMFCILNRGASPLELPFTLARQDPYAPAPLGWRSFAVRPSMLRNGARLRRPAQVLEQHHVHDQSRDTSTTGRMNLFRRSIEHDENRIASGDELAERRIRGQH